MRKTPYQRLLEATKSFRAQVLFPKQVSGGFFDGENVKERHGFRLDTLMQAIETASSLGYDTKLAVSERGIEIKHVKRHDDIDYYIEG